MAELILKDNKIVNQDQMVKIAEEYGKIVGLPKPQIRKSINWERNVWFTKDYKNGFTILSEFEDLPEMPTQIQFFFTDNRYMTVGLKLLKDKLTKDWKLTQNGKAGSYPIIFELKYEIKD